MSHRAALILRGEGGLVACAEELHRFACGKDAPFVVCDPRRRRGPATVRAPANHASIEDALPSASGGSLCVLSRRPPPDLAAAIPGLLAPDSAVLLMICGTLPADRAFASTTICIPPVADRGAEIDRVIEDASASAAEDLGATTFTLSVAERAWIRARCASSIAEITTAVRRLIALREGGSVAAGASLLGMSHVALGEWFARRRGPKDRIGIW